MSEYVYCENKETLRRYLAYELLNNEYRLYSEDDDTGKSDITISKEKFKKEYNVLSDKIFKEMYGEDLTTSSDSSLIEELIDIENDKNKLFEKSRLTVLSIIEEAVNKNYSKLRITKEQSQELIDYYKNQLLDSKIVFNKLKNVNIIVGKNSSLKIKSDNEEIDDETYMIPYYIDDGFYEDEEEDFIDIINDYKLFVLNKDELFVISIDELDFSGDYYLFCKMYNNITKIEENAKNYILEI